MNRTAHLWGNVVGAFYGIPYASQATVTRYLRAVAWRGHVRTAVCLQLRQLTHSELVGGLACTEALTEIEATFLPATVIARSCGLGWHGHGGTKVP